MRSALAIFIRRPVFTWVLVLSLVVLGAVGFYSLTVERYPNVDIPYVTITTAAPGLSSQQLERDVTQRLENAVSTLGGLERLDSTSREGLSVVAASFILSKDSNLAAQQVRQAIAAVAQDLPAAASAPQVETLNLGAAPIVQLALTSPRGTRGLVELGEVADLAVRRALQGIDGVGDLQLLGAPPRVLEILLDPLALAAADLTAVEVQQALSRENLEVPGGERLEGAHLVGLRLSARATSVEALRQVVVRAQGKTPIVLGSLGTVAYTQPLAVSAARLSGTEAVAVAVLKRAGANTIEVARAVREALPGVQAQLPSDTQLTVVTDDSLAVVASLEAVEEHLVVGALLAALVVLLFLRDGRATLISALAIPASVVGTFAVVKALGMTLNMLSLLGLTLAVGIVIDDAIVVLENVVRVLRLGNRTPAQAALEATGEIALAVFATTLSLVAVFLPVAFMEGIVGRYLAPFGLTMSVSILLSMGVAFTLTPMLCARWLKAPTPEATATAAPAHADGWLELQSTRLLTWALAHRGVVAATLLLTLASMVPLTLALPLTFLPDEDEARFSVYLRLPEGTAAAQTELIAERVARAARALEAVEHTLVTVGSPRGATRDTQEALVTVTLSRRGLTGQHVATVREQVLPALLPPGSLGMVGKGDDTTGGIGPEGAQVQYVLRSEDPQRLLAVARQLEARARALPGVVDVGSSHTGSRAALTLSVDRARAAQLGLSHEALASALAMASERGVPSGSLREGESSAELRLRVDPRGSPAEAALREVTVRAADGRRVPLTEVASLTRGPVEGPILRTGRQRQVTVFMNVVPGTSEQAAVFALDAALAQLEPQGRVRGEVVGNAKELEKTTRAFGLALLLSLTFMYLVLAAQFESWVHPLTILSSLPLTVPFGLLSLWLGGQSLNLFSALGFLVLFGVVKKNAILQVDHTLALRREGLGREEAVLLANRHRLRPILMTTLAFVAGLLPLVVSSGAGAATNRAIAVGLLGGQSLSLVLTLVATPVLYTWLDDAQAWWARRQGAPRQPATSAF